MGRREPRYVGTAQTARRWAVSQELVRLLCREGRIKGAKRDPIPGAIWFIPRDAVRPPYLPPSGGQPFHRNYHSKENRRGKV